MTIEEADDLIRKAPSFPALREAYLRFIRRLYKCNAPAVDDLEREPHQYLTVHSHVMNYQSQACKTMQRLTHQIFRETGLPRIPPGKFRGMDGLDTAKLEQHNAERKNAESENV
jgi:hypothetical protein